MKLNNPSTKAIKQSASWTILLALVSTSAARALPFSPDPISFAGYLNSSRGWYDRTLKIRFESLGNCEYNYLIGYEYYTCRIGYARIKDGISERKCRVTVQYDGSSRQTGYNEYECRKVSYEEKGRELYERAKQWWLSK